MVNTTVTLTRTELFNITWPANNSESFAFVFIPLINCSIGIPVNLLVLFLSFCSPHIKGNYKYFLANLSICNLMSLSCLIFEGFFHLYYVIFDVPMNVFRCTLENIIGYAARLCLGYAMPFTWLNRYFVIARNQEQRMTFIFQGQGVHLNRWTQTCYHGSPLVVIQWRSKFRLAEIWEYRFYWRWTFTPTCCDSLPLLPLARSKDP
jgi:hypothetical protein